MDGGFQAVHAAGENLQIRTLLFKKKNYIVNSAFFFLTIWWKAPFWLVGKKKDRYLGDPARARTGRS
jgi:hypothetical protein